MLSQQKIDAPIRLIGIGVSGFSNESITKDAQLTLFDEPANNRTEQILKKEQLSKAIDNVRANVLDGGDIRLGVGK